MALYTLNLSLTLLMESPLHIGTGYGLAGYLDAVTITDALGYPYVPGSSIKGRLRYYLHKLLPALASEQEDSESLDLLFGSVKQSGALFFDDFHLTPEWASLLENTLGQPSVHGLARSAHGVLSRRQTNVMISRLRGVAFEQRLFTVESAPQHLAYSGSIHGQLESQAPMDGGHPRAAALLVAAVKAFTHLGGRKSRGLGRCHLQIEKEGMSIDGTVVDADTLLNATQACVACNKELE